MKRWHKLAALAAGVAALAGAGATARVADAAPSAQAPIQVGVVYSRTGLLASYGAQFVQGLRYGIAYATKGTSAVNGRKIELTLVDDGTDPVKAVAGAKDLIGKGYKIITGTASSGIALQLAPLADQNKVLYISGPAATDAVTGVNKYTFRAGRQSYQDVLAASSYLGGGGGKNVTVFAQDSAFGLGNFLAVQQVMGNLGGQKVNRILVPLSAQDFTPFAQQIKQQRTDLLFIAWAGHDGARDVAGARPAGHLLERRQGRHRPRPAGVVPDVRAGREQDLVPLALRLERAEEQGQRLARRRR